MNLFVSFLILFMGIGGFFISRHIYRSKKKGAKLVCFIGKGKRTCNEVVESAYAKTLGVPNELLGMGYYVLLTAGAILLIFQDSSEALLVKLIAVFSGVAFLMSLYLVGIQAFVLKKFCEWCLATAAINTIVFLLIILTLFW